MVQHRGRLVRAVRENEVGETKRLLEEGAPSPTKLSISVITFHAVCLLPTSDVAADAVCLTYRDRASFPLPQ